MYDFSVGRIGRNLAEKFPGGFLGLSRFRDVDSLSFPDVNIAVLTLLLPNRGSSFSSYLLEMIRNLLEYALNYNTHTLKS